MLPNSLNLVFDLFFPRFNFDYSNFCIYLNQKEIEQQKAKIIYLEGKDLQKILPKILVCSRYQKNIQDLIKRAKINGETAICPDFVNLILCAQKKTDFPLPDYLCFVPPDPKRHSQRGYHLPQILAKNLSKSLNLPVLDILSKTKATASQTELNRQNRLTNLQNVFEIKQTNFDLTKIETEIETETKTIWLIDDVTTTQTTLLNCAKTLKKTFPLLKIYGVTVAG